MSKPTGEEKGGIKVKMFQLTNRLRAKLGMDFQHDDKIGEIPEEAIAEADKLIDRLCAECPQTMKGLLEGVVAQWEEMKDLPRSEERDEYAQKIFTLAHEIKDISAMCGYELAAYFSESLRDYIAKTELKLNAQRVIIQAHVDALQVVIKQGMDDVNDPAAQELKEMVKVAIGKYS